MSRKITSLLTLLAVMFFSLPALAVVDELNMKSVTIGEAVTEISPDRWYVLTSQGRPGYVRTEGVGNTIMNRDRSLLADGAMATEVAGFLMRFVEAGDSLYYIQSGEGCYFGTLTSGGNSGAVAEASVPYKVQYLDGINGWWIYENQTPLTLDTNPVGTSVSGWGTGEPAAGGNACWTISEVVFTSLSTRELLEKEINKRLALYEQYLEGRGDTLDIGPEIGQYNVTKEEYETWVGHVQKAFDILDGKYPDITDEEIQAELDAIDEGWAYIQSKLVELEIADGNYRIVSAITWTNTAIVPGENPEVSDTITTNPRKAIYATLDTKQAKWADIDSTDCRYLWKLTNVGEDSIQVMNIATDGIIATMPTSAVATLDPESTQTMSFMFVKRTADGKAVLSFEPQGGGQYNFAHCGGHGGGKGKAGNIVGWSNGTQADASQWVLEPVDDETVAKLIEDYAPYKNHEVLVQNYQTLQARGDSAIAVSKDDSYIVTRGEGLLTSGEQFSSPFTCTAEQEPKGASFDNLFDGDNSTYWHSDWSSSVPAHTHYFNVTLDDPVADGTMLQAYIYRRNVKNDHITAMTVYGANDGSAIDDATEASWTRLDSINTPWTSGQTEVTSGLFNAAGYKYLRFYIDNTAGSEITSTRGYAHMAQFQLYPATIDGNTQYSQMGEVKTNLEAALAKADTIDTEELTMDDYNELQAAVDAFLAALVDPAELASTINANKNTAQYVVIGTNPGQWAEGSNGDALNKLLDEAQAYIKSGAYTHEKTDNYIAQIKATADGIMESANKVETGKWYSIRFDTEENYDKYGWPKGNVVNTTLGDLYGNYLIPANQVTEGEETFLQGYDALDDICIGQELRFADEQRINNVDQMAFRFVAVGDTAFYIQHKSGLYMASMNRGNTLTLGLTPGLFDVKACGLGKVLVHARNLKGEELYDEPIYLHAQNAGHALVTWNATDIGSNSALFIEPISESDLESPDIAESIKMNVVPNSMRIWCYGTGYKVSGGQLYEYKGAAINETEISLAFNEIEETRPGQPVLYLNGDTTAFDKDAEVEPEELTIIGNEFAAEPDSVGGIHGRYEYLWVDPYVNVVVAGGVPAREGNFFEEAYGEDATDCSRDIAANSGYIVPAENVIDNFNAADYSLVITVEKNPNAIGKVASVVNSRGDIYSVDGKLLKKNGTLSDIKAMGRGLYIIGGAKVMVK